jgi:predicted nucleotidyltransferase
MKYPTVFHLVSSVFNKKAAACVLIGGFAVNFHKVQRATLDVDFLTTKEGFEAVYDILQEAGFKKFSEQETFVQLENDKAHIKNLDFMFVDKDVLDKIIKEGKDVTIAGQDLKIPSLFHLIALKLHSIKFDKKREYKDLMDIVYLIKNNKVDIKSEEFRNLCLKFGTEVLYNRILKHLG